MVFAEIAVAAAFIGKVVVDVQAKNLDDAIKNKDFELQAFATSSEPTLRTLQQKALNYAKVWDASSSYADVLKEMDTYIPNTGSNLSIRINGDQVTVRGDDNLQVLSVIEQAMRASKTFKTVSVSSLSSDSGNVQDNTGVLVLNATLADVTARQSIK